MYVDTSTFTGELRRQGNMFTDRYTTYDTRTRKPKSKFAKLGFQEDEDMVMPEDVLNNQPQGNPIFMTPVGSPTSTSSFKRRPYLSKLGFFDRVEEDAIDRLREK